MKAKDLKRGHAVSLGGRVCMVRDIQARSPTSRGGNTIYKVAYRDVVTGQKVEETYKGDDALVPAEVVRRPVQLLFAEPGSVTFMDTDTYNQYLLGDDALEAERPYITDDAVGLQMVLVAGMPASLELPATVELEVIECAPGMKGASSSARTKPATLSTGLVVQVPEYIAAGERIRVNTASGEFAGRA